MKKLFAVAAALALLVLGVCAQAVTKPDMVRVGNPGNLDDTLSNRGGVDYFYRIAKTEVTNAQYVEFLNAVAAENDPYGLFNVCMELTTHGGIVRGGSSGSYLYSVKPDAVGRGPLGSDYTYANKPVCFVSWYDSIRYCNWLTSGNTESGTYLLIGSGAEPTEVIIPDHSALTAGHYFLPTEDEWFKAAYYDPLGFGDPELNDGYWHYPMGTPRTPFPDNNLPSEDSGNSANCVGFPPDPCDYTTGDPEYPMTDVGAYTLSASDYGTFDQGGNVFEWNETGCPGANGVDRIGLGSAWDLPLLFMQRTQREAGDPLTEQPTLGFRVAAPPEPPIGINNRAAYDPIISLVARRHNFKVWGKVTILDSTSFTLNDGSGMHVKVIAPGYGGIANDDYACASGELVGDGLNRALRALASDVVKLH